MMDLYRNAAKGKRRLLFLFFIFLGNLCLGALLLWLAPGMDTMVEQAANIEFWADMLLRELFALILRGSGSVGQGPFTLGGQEEQKDLPSLEKEKGLNKMDNPAAGNPPGFNLNWPLTANGEAQDLNLPASFDQSDQLEKDQILKQCKDQMFRSWQREPRPTKKMLEPATRGMSVEMYILEFLSRRWQEASLEEIRAQKDELLTHKGHSCCYLDYRNDMEEASFSESNSTLARK